MIAWNVMATLLVIYRDIEKKFFKNTLNHKYFYWYLDIFIGHWSTIITSELWLTLNIKLTCSVNVTDVRTLGCSATSESVNITCTAFS